MPTGSSTATSSAWCATPRRGSRRRRSQGLKLEVVRLEGRTPVIFFEVPATQAPAATRHDLPVRPPRQAARVQRLAQRPRPVDAEVRGRPALRPRRRRRRLRGLRRDHRDPGARRRRASPRPRCVGLIETCEESGSFDLPAYIDALRPASATSASSSASTAAPATTTSSGSRRSLRGMVSGTLKVEILTEGVHSGDASGLVPSSFRILRQVLDRLEDSEDRPPAAARASTARSRPTASSRRRRPRRSSATRSGSASRGRCGADGATARAADHDRPGRGAAQPHLEADAVGHRRRRLPGAEGRRQRAAPVHRVQAVACACRRWSTPTPRRRS